MTSINEVIAREFKAHLKTIQTVIVTMKSDLGDASSLVVEVLKRGNKVLLCGNGGSAADAQHIAAELTGRYKTERRGLAGIALTTDTSALTAISNDYGYNKVFDRQVEALANSGDLLIGISTSGNSKNIIEALKECKKKKIITVGLTGGKDCEMDNLCDICIKIPSTSTPRIQESHIVVGHIICAIIEEEMFGKGF